MSDARGAESERGAGDFVYDDIVDLLPNYGLDDFESPLIRGSTKKETDLTWITTDRISNGAFTPKSRGPTGCSSSNSSYYYITSLSKVKLEGDAPEIDRDISMLQANGQNGPHCSSNCCKQDHPSG